MRRIWIVAVLLLLPGAALAGELRLKLNHSGPDATVELSGDAGREYLIESARGSLNEWTPVTSFILNDPPRLWKDGAAQSGNRFFRARSIEPGQEIYANNFRLIDQNGVSRELYYYNSLGTLKAIVLVFAEGNYSAFASKITQLKSAFPNNVFFWVIETGTGATRAKIKTDATAAGLGTTPIYHDPMQLVTQDLDAQFNGEAFVISRADMRIVYRGVIDDGANNYVSAALTSLVGNSQVTTTRMEPTQNGIVRAQREVADYSATIIPILKSKCVVCHSPENIGPFVMFDHQTILERAASIKEEVMAGNMPPWHADPLYGKFENDISLSPTEKAKLIDWIDAGLPRGTGPDSLTALPPPPPKWPAELGEPDQVVTIPVQEIPETGTIDYRYISAYATNPTDKWLKAAVVRPSNRTVVHHYIVWEGHSTTPQLSGIAGYAPGRTDKPYPEGTGVLLRANSPLTFNLHYTAHGHAETDQPELGLWYADAPPAKTMKTAAVINYTFNPIINLITIPAGNPDFEMVANYTFSNPVRLYSFSPHMHVRGLRMRFELTLPGSSVKQILLSVPKYNFEWQTIYTLETPLDLPGGARIDVIGGFDNSAQNVYNPDPTKGVKWGDQSWEEMFIGYMEFSDR